jgi:hypothetical protein
VLALGRWLRTMGLRLSALVYEHEQTSKGSRRYLAAKCLYLCGWLSATLAPLGTVRAAQEWFFASLHNVSHGVWLAWLVAAIACGTIAVCLISLGCDAEKGLKTADCADGRG